MKKEIFSFSKKVLFLLFTLSILTFQNVFSQCTNPIPVGNTNHSFCAVDNSKIGDLNVSGGTIVWFDSPNGGNKYSESATLTNGYSYYAEDIDGGNCSPRLEVKVSIYGAVPANVDVFVGKCASDNPTISELSADGSNIVWYNSQAGGSIINISEPLANGVTYWVQQTQNGCTSERLPTTVNLINPTSPNVESIQSFCSSTNPTIGDLQAVQSNIIWYDTETSSIPLSPTFSLIDGEDYWAAQTSFPCESTIRTKTTVSIDIATNAGTKGTYSTCEEDLQTTNLFELLGGLPENNGVWSGPSSLSGGYLGVFEPGVNTEGTYTYTVTSSGGVCADATATVNVSIITVPPPTITNSSQSFCETQAATVNDLLPNGNEILWYDAQTNGNLLNATDSLVDGNIYWAAQADSTMGCESLSRNAVTASIINTLPPTISNSSQSFCETQAATVNDLLPNGNGVLWYDAQTNGNLLNATDSLVDGNTYWAAQTDATTGCESLSRNGVTVSIINTLPPTISNSSQSFCETQAATVSDLLPNSNGILWYDAQTNGNLLNATDSLVDGSIYWAAQTDATTGCESISRNVVTVSIIVTPPPTVSNSSQSFCETQAATVNDLLPNGNGILWYDAQTNGNLLNATANLVDGNTYWAAQTDTTTSCESLSRNAVTVSILVIPPPVVNSSNQSFCEIDFSSNLPTVDDLDVSGTNISWYNSETSSTPLNGSDLLIHGQAYWAAQTDATTGCESVTRMVVNVSIPNPPIAEIPEAIQTFCLVNNPTVANLQATGDLIVWYNEESSTTPLNATDLLINGEDYWALNTDASTGCESASKQMVTVNIIDEAPAAIENVSQFFCGSNSPTISNLQASGIVEWYALENEKTPLNTSDLLINGNTYWAAAINNVTGCTSSIRIEVTVTLTSTETPILASQGNEFCIIDNPQLNDLDSNVFTTNDGNVIWYDSYPNGNVLSLSQLLNDGETYYAIQIDTDGCTSLNPLEVIVDLGACEKYDIITYDGFSPNGDGINDTFKVEYIETLYPNFKIQIYNRWGNLMYTCDNRKPDWNGRLNGDGNFAPSGMYYYIINYNKDSKKPKQGRFYLSR